VCPSTNEVKSRAVVKYSAAPPPTSYALLQEQTDLKLPPANWLRESPQLGTAGSTVLGSSSKSKPFSRYSTLRLHWSEENVREVLVKPRYSCHYTKRILSYLLYSVTSHNVLKF